MAAEEDADEFIDDVKSGAIDEVSAFDTKRSEWYDAKVICCTEKGIEIHFVGWNKRYVSATLHQYCCWHPDTGIALYGRTSFWHLKKLHWTEFAVSRVFCQAGAVAVEADLGRSNPASQLTA